MQFKSIPLTDIAIPERLRATDEGHAQAIAASIREHGLINPITLRHTPAAKAGKYHLVAGAHRHRAMAILKEPEILAVIVVADQPTALLLEIEENLFRNDLTKLDRAVYVSAFREIWEAEHGEIKAGRPNWVNLHQLDTQPGFSAWCAERLGLSADAIKRSYRIAKNIPADLKSALYGTPAEDNQSVLLRFANLPATQLKLAAAAFEEADGDIEKCFEILVGVPAKIGETRQLINRFVGTFGKANTRQQRQLLAEIGVPGDVVEAVIKQWKIDAGTKKDTRV